MPRRGLYGEWRWRKKIELQRARTLSPIFGNGMIKFFIFAKNNERKFSLLYSYVVALGDQFDMGKTNSQSFFRDL
jgi:hypothetical protein